MSIVTVMKIFGLSPIQANWLRSWPDCQTQDRACQNTHVPGFFPMAWLKIRRRSFAALVKAGGESSGGKLG